jgi:hypothetical protein
LGHYVFGDGLYYSASHFPNNSIAGSVGLSPLRTGTQTDLPATFASQFNTTAASVAMRPMVSVYTNLTRNNTGCCDTYDNPISMPFNAGQGQVTLGGEDGDNCVAGGYSYTPLVVDDGWAPSFRVEYIDGLTPDGAVLNLTIRSDRATRIYRGGCCAGASYSYATGVLYLGSTDFNQLLANASGLYYDYNYGYRLSSSENGCVLSSSS